MRWQWIWLVRAWLGLVGLGWLALARLVRKTDESLLTWSRHRIDRRGNHVAEAEDYPNDGYVFDRHIDRPDLVHASLSTLEERPSSVAMEVYVAEAGNHSLQAVT